MKRRKVIITPEARADLRRISRTVAKAAGHHVATRYLARVLKYCTDFDLAGERGTRRDDVRRGIRIVGFERRLTLAFMVADEHVLFLRVLEAGRDWQHDV